MSKAFRALIVEDVDGKPKASFKDQTLSDLQDFDVLVEIAYSTLNYKDGLAVSGRQRIARKPPLTAGIDLAGTVVEFLRAGLEVGRPCRRQRMGALGAL